MVDGYGLGLKKRLARQLLSRQLTIEDLSKQIDVSLDRLEHCLAVSNEAMSVVEIIIRVAHYFGVTVEYLVTGEKIENKYSSYTKVLDDLMMLPLDMRESIQVMIHAAAEAELQKKEVSISRA